ncbi:putative late blight resistance protein homolog R1B-16 [Salvia hispanica]|uniref:putative late blight resistance protein homolog R1B-16 n=1 Tax=Salvia hispanica TaxID=49212 RepID=UPI002009279C|nr:putative late blight resistance protein homolog R1B-16 [Salvia hispanica]
MQKVIENMNLIMIDIKQKVVGQDQLHIIKSLNTTRLSNLASQFNYSRGLDMKILDEYDGWNLFSNIVFREESCPLELEDIGKKIVKACKGLPLAIVVIGGLLSKSERTRESWELSEKDLSSIVNLDDYERCLQILYLSYSNLPVHLKLCLLYMGSYDKDCVIRMSYLIPFFVAEGFVKPINGKCLEETAEEYINELIDRNLLIVEKRKHCGKLKSFKMHDLLRDVCLREARKLKFLCVLEKQSIPEAINCQRRIVSLVAENEYQTPLRQSLESASLVRSFIGACPTSLSCNFRLSRVCLMSRCLENEDSYEEFFVRLVNLRLLAVNLDERLLPRLLSSVSFFWNLQTIYLFGGVGDEFVFDIWKVPQLRHVITDEDEFYGAYCLPDPISEEEDMVLENLQTLYTVLNLKFGKGVLKRIPNIKTLKLCYDTKVGEEDDYHLNNLYCLQKLENLRIRCCVEGSHLVREVRFPHSLKKLTLGNTNFPWDDMKTKIGLLPLLQVLQLKSDSVVGSEWKTSEDQFLNLKFLLIEDCDVEWWITDNTHFPRLEHLHLHYVERLREIPSCMRDIPTLHSIKLKGCNKSVVDSAQKIKEEQQELSNEDLQIIFDQVITMR